jgi:hypothetical protein
MFGYGALDAIASCFPEGHVCYFDRIDGFIHRFKQIEDASLIAARRGGEAIIFETAKELASIPREHLEAVASALDVQAPPAKITTNYIKELFDMATKAKAKQAKKVKSVQAKAKRADGPVAKAHAAFAKVSDPTDTSKMLDAAKKAGVTEGTAKTQLYIWRKENGVKATRGRPNAGGKAKKTKTAKTKKAGGKKKTAAKGKKAKPRPAAPVVKAKSTKKPLAKPTASAAVSTPPGRIEAPPQASIPVGVIAENATGTEGATVRE